MAGGPAVRGPVRLVLFDMDGVLCRYDLPRRLRELARVTGRAPEEVRRAIWGSGFEDRADAGAYATAGDYLRAFGERLGHGVSRPEWVAARAAAMAPHEEVIALAARVARRAEVCVFTNNGPLLREEFPALLPRAHAVFGDRLVCSSEVGARKPDPVSFARVAERLGTAPAVCLMIDDLPENARGARAAGMRAHRFASAGALEADLAAAGLLDG